MTSGELVPDRGDIVFSIRTFGPTAPRLNMVPEKLLISLLFGDVSVIFPELINS